MRMNRAAQRPGGESQGVASSAFQPSDRFDGPFNSTTPVEPRVLTEVLDKLADILPGLQRALELQARPRVEPLAYRLDQLAEALGSSPRLIQKEVSAGRFPRPLKLGRVSVWPVEALREFLAQQAAGGRRSRS
jgi:predicted DNA-binding transcriptional regulator AlpA